MVDKRASWWVWSLMGAPFFLKLAQADRDSLVLAVSTGTPSLRRHLKKIPSFFQN